MTSLPEEPEFESDGEIVRYRCAWCGKEHTNPTVIINHIRDSDRGRHDDRNPYQEPIQIQGLDVEGKLVKQLASNELFESEAPGQNTHQGTMKTSLLPEGVTAREGSTKAKALTTAISNPNLHPQAIAQRLYPDAEEKGTLDQRATYVYDILRENLSKDEYEKRLENPTLREKDEGDESDSTSEKDFSKFEMGLADRLESLTEAQLHVLEAYLRNPNPASHAENSRRAGENYQYTYNLVTGNSRAGQNFVRVLEDAKEAIGGELQGPPFVVELPEDKENDEEDVDEDAREENKPPADHTDPEKETESEGEVVLDVEVEPPAVAVPRETFREFERELSSRRDAAERNKDFAPRNSTMETAAKAELALIEDVEKFLVEIARTNGNPGGESQ